MMTLWIGFATHGLLEENEPSKNKFLSEFVLVVATTLKLFYRAAFNR